MWNLLVSFATYIIRLTFTLFFPQENKIKYFFIKFCKTFRSFWRMSLIIYSKAVNSNFISRPLSHFCRELCLSKFDFTNYHLIVLPFWESWVKNRQFSIVQAGLYISELRYLTRWKPRILITMNSVKNLGMDWISFTPLCRSKYGQSPSFYFRIAKNHRKWCLPRLSRYLEDCAIRWFKRLFSQTSF